MTRGDDATLRALFEQHGAPLLAYVTRLAGGDHGRAEDIVQETLLRAWRHVEALEDTRGSVRAWLFTVAHNVAVDAYRARQSRPHETGENGLTFVPAADEIELALDRWLIAEAVATLPAHQRAVIVETYYRGRTVTEAAEALGIPAGTVKSRTFHALRALRLALEERGVTA